ncbi:MAG TPA: hypothetical protein VHA74_01195 [Candidatus Dojkabacteria bacterium]|nr:hypothetical protein [Candidatus Dojkabacteria bacterium]
MKSKSLVSKLKRVVQRSVVLNPTHFRNISVTRIPNYYGTNRNVFIVSLNQDKIDYFAKVTKSNNIRFNTEVSEHINVPKRYLSTPTKLGNIEFYHYIKGELLTDILLNSQGNPKKENITLKHENDKNKSLLSMYKRTKVSVPYNKILRNKANDLFYKRLFGNRFDEYYKNAIFKELFAKKLVINGKKFSSVNTIINRIKNKYCEIDIDKNVEAILGHGDAHHQNILIENTSNNIYFIDNEYNSLTSLNMEIAKPYYIDLLGNYFFFFNEQLLDIFEVEKYYINADSIEILIKLKSIPTLRVKTAENKISIFKNLLKKCDDPIKLNDYLLMSHLLSRNPSLYAKKILPIFIAYIPIIASFNTLKPQDLFDVFK